VKRGENQSSDLRGEALLGRNPLEEPNSLGKKSPLYIREVYSLKGELLSGRLPRVLGARSPSYDEKKRLVRCERWGYQYTSQRGKERERPDSQSERGLNQGATSNG